MNKIDGAGCAKNCKYPPQMTSVLEMNNIEKPVTFPFKNSTWGFLKALLWSETPSFQIWIGNGNNGKSALLSAVAETFHYRFIRFLDPKDLLRCRFKNHFLVVDDWESTVKIPSAVILRLLELGNTVILVSSTYPILVNPTNALLEQTHVIPFVNSFTASNPNARYDPTKWPALLLDEAVELYSRALLTGEESGRHMNAEPADCYQAKKQLRLLAVHLPRFEVAPSRVEWPSTGPTEPTAVPDSTAPSPPTLTIKEESKEHIDPVKMDDCKKNKILLDKIEVNKIVDNLNTVKSFNLGIPVPAPEPVPAPAPVLPTVVQATVEEPATDDSDEAPNYADISMLLVHKDRSRPDDVLTIRVDPYSDGFYVTVDQKYIGSSCTAYFGANDLPGYLRGFFQSMQYDDDGYSHVQFAAPLFPAVVVKRRYTLEYLNYQLIPQISFLLNDWPTDEFVRGPWRSGQ